MEIDNHAKERIKKFESVLTMPTDSEREGRAPGKGISTYNGGALYTGVDLGTAYIVTAVVDSKGTPVAGALTRSRSSVRDGLVLDYMGAISILQDQVAMLRKAGFELSDAAAAYPPGTSGRNAGAFQNVLEAVELEVKMLTDEPTAAACLLDIRDGAVVDIGGGTTGISVIEEGRVVYTADEATGGTHVDLVLAGSYKVSPHEAEMIKRDNRRQSEVFQVIRPVFQKMASIVRTHLRSHPVKTLYLVGGTSCFPGIEKVMADETGLDVLLPSNPLLVTPLGIACSLRNGLETEFEGTPDPPDPTTESEPSGASRIVQENSPIQFPQQAGSREDGCNVSSYC